MSETRGRELAKLSSRCVYKSVVPSSVFVAAARVFFAHVDEYAPKTSSSASLRTYNRVQARHNNGVAKGESLTFISRPLTFCPNSLAVYWNGLVIFI